VDGVLTDGTLAYTAEGEVVKHFNAHDGFGIRMLIDHGVDVAVISARHSPALARRMTDLKIVHFYPGYDNKREAFNALLEKLAISPQQVAYVGDDVLDLPVMRLVGLPIAVGNAHFYARETALWITSNTGGKGAVREVADGILSSRMNLKHAYDAFLESHVGRTKMDTV